MTTLLDRVKIVVQVFSFWEREGDGDDRSSKLRSKRKNTPARSSKLRPKRKNTSVRSSKLRSKRKNTAVRSSKLRPKRKNTAVRSSKLHQKSQKLPLKPTPPPTKKEPTQIERVLESNFFILQTVRGAIGNRPLFERGVLRGFLVR